jgi:metallo-beta-lactamase class B
MRIDPFPILPRLFHVGDRVVSVHLLDTGDGLILFDSGFPHAASLLLENIAALGHAPSDIRYILHSHEHYDHFGATRLLQARHGCRTFLHEKGVETFLLRPHHTEIQASNCPEASLFIPDVALRDGDRVRLGDADILCVHTPGHSPGSVSYFFELAHGGRKVKVGLCGVNGNLTLHPGRLLKYGLPLDSGRDYLGSIEAMLGVEVDLALDTHPRPGGVVERHLSGSGKLVDPLLWGDNLRDYRSRYLDMMAKFEERLRAAR